jgi:hypothetical protein
VPQYIDAMIKEMYLLGACSLFVKKSPSFGLYRPEKEILNFDKNGKFKFQIDLDRHGPRHYSTIAILLNPLPFHCTLPLRHYWVAVAA